MEMNYVVGRNNMGMGDYGSGYWLPEANYYQQNLFMPILPFSMVMNAAAAASFSEFANSTAGNVVGSNHNEEVDRFLLLQIQQIKSTLEHQWKQNLSSLLMNLEAKFVLLLMQKDNDLAEQRKSAIKLLKKTILEKQKWEKIARKLSCIVSSFNQRLEQVQKPCFSSTGEIEEEEDESEEPAAKRRRESSHGTSSLCQVCSSSAACVLILPCRHLCLCKKCEVLHFGCPVCKCVKKDTVEVLFP